MPHNRRRQGGFRAMVIAGAAMLMLGCAKTEPERKDPIAEPVAEFSKRVEAYVALRNRLAETMGPLDETKSQADIAARAVTLGKMIQQERATAKPGDLFTAEVASVFATIIKEEYSRRPDSLRETRGDAQEELPDFVPRVDSLYPTSYPLATFPASLLPILPVLPKEVEYRIVNRYLLLRDVEANLIVDFMPNAVPEVQYKP